MEDVSSFIKLVSEYGILVVISGLFLVMVCRMFSKQQKWLEEVMNRFILAGSPSSSRISKDDIDALEIVNEKIYQEVRGVVNSIDSDRAYVYLYHNGGVSLSGLHFQKMSCICEVVSQGVLPVADRGQNLYRASYATLCESLKTKGYYSVSDCESLKGVDDFMYDFYKSRHIESSHFRALKDSQGNTIGFVGVDYCSSSGRIRQKYVNEVLSMVSVKLSSLVDIRDEVRGK